MAQQFEHSSDDSQLRTQRMTADESRAVIDLWQQERVEKTGLTDKPALPDVAEGLDITVEDVQRLLKEVRVRREEESRLLAQEQEFSEIRLAEEERKLAEIQRQRAELRREQVEATRYQATVQEADKRYVPQPSYEDTYELSGTDRVRTIFTACGIFVSLAVLIMLAGPHRKQVTSSPPYILTGPYTEPIADVNAVPVKCYNEYPGPGGHGAPEVPCSAEVVAHERQNLQKQEAERNKKLAAEAKYNATKR